MTGLGRGRVLYRARPRLSVWDRRPGDEQGATRPIILPLPGCDGSVRQLTVGTGPPRLARAAQSSRRPLNGLRAPSALILGFPIIPINP